MAQQKGDESLEELTILMLCDNKTNTLKRIEILLQQLLYYLKVFYEPDECIDYIISIENENKKVLLILVGDVYGTYDMIDLIYEIQQILFIYILYDNKYDCKIKYLNNLTKKVVGEFIDENLLYKKLVNDIEKYNTIIPMTICNLNDINPQKSIRDLTKEQSIF
ncbi:unnamed protein product, partial [Didymodactylos carnosus]